VGVLLKVVYIADAHGARYESIKTQTVPAAKKSGQLGSMYTIRLS
jgi:hypothetical protein